MKKLTVQNLNQVQKRIDQIRRQLRLSRDENLVLSLEAELDSLIVLLETSSLAA